MAKQSNIWGFSSIKDKSKIKKEIQKDLSSQLKDEKEQFKDFEMILKNWSTPNKWDAKAEQSQTNKNNITKEKEYQDNRNKAKDYSQMDFTFS